MTPALGLLLAVAFGAPALAQTAPGGDGAPPAVPGVVTPGAAPGAPAGVADLVSTTALRVCADPGNAPLSSQDGSGFENKVAELLASKLGVPVEYTWFPQSTGFVRRTLTAKRCDLIMGYAQGDELVQNTNHYYSSAYVLITRADDPLAEVTTLTDPRLKGHALGVTGGSPPVDHMLRAGLIGQMHSYVLPMDRRVQDPAGDMLRDLKSGAIDGAILWGPIGGPAAKADPDLHLQPLLSEAGQPRMVYRITMGVRPSDQDWKRKINSLIRRNQPQIDAILRDAGVPLVDDEGTALKPVAP